jgi:hypothetical protein
MTPCELAVLLRRLDELKARSPGGRGMTWSASTTGCGRPPGGRRDPGTALRRPAGRRVQSAVWMLILAEYGVELLS